jgi:hypothetical protein
MYCRDPRKCTVVKTHHPRMSGILVNHGTTPYDKHLGEGVEGDMYQQKLHPSSKPA